MISEEVLKILAQYSKTLEEEKTPFFRKGKSKTVVANKADQMLDPQTVKKGSINGKQFIEAIKNAGKRMTDKINEMTGEVNRISIFQHSLQREDVVNAIHAYIGYDSRQNFGEQEARARQSALREIHPVKAEEYKRCAIKPTIAGYVAGMPNAEKRLADNIQAKVALTIDELKNEKGEFDF